MAYRVVLALHLVAVISWMAGILYLFRLFIYHRLENEAVVKSRFEVMESRLFRIITVPAMIATAAFGITMLVLAPGLLSLGWMHAKLTLVAGLIVLTLWANRIRGQLRQGTCPLSPRHLRFLNEAPTLLMIFIVFLVILKPVWG